MTDMPPLAATLLRRLPLGVRYPAKYRAAHGAEIAAVYAESVRHTDSRTALRECACAAPPAAPAPRARTDRRRPTRCDGRTAAAPAQRSRFSGPD